MKTTGKKLIVYTLQELDIKNETDYLKKYQARNLDELTFENKAKLFIEVLEDFFNFKTSIYQVSRIGAALHHSLSSPEMDTKLGTALYWAMESIYYLHVFDEDNNAGRLNLAGAINHLNNLYTDYLKTGNLGLDKDQDILTRKDKE